MPNTFTDTNIKEIDRRELLQLLDVGAKLVDVRDSSNYEKEHIKGAISLPLNEIRMRVKSLLDENETIIVYCTNIECPASISAAKILLSLNYKNVLYYKGGLADYKKANLPLGGTSHVGY